MVAPCQSYTGKMVCRDGFPEVPACRDGKGKAPHCLDHDFFTPHLHEDDGKMLLRKKTP